MSCAAFDIYSISSDFYKYAYSHLDFNYLDPFYSYVEYLFNLNLELFPEETIIFSDKKLFNKQQFFIDEDSNIEKEISSF